MKYIGIILLSLSLSCSNESDSDDLAIEDKYWNIDLPSFMGNTIPSVTRNPITAEGVTLGRMLFYDPILSSNSKVSCASCHALELAFADGKSLSNNGVTGDSLKRNSPALFNLAWHEGLFWEGGAIDVESQVAGPILDPDELGNDPKGIITRLSNHSDYQKRFKQVFDKNEIEIGDVAKVISQFERTIISYQSKYDDYKNGQTSLSINELNGLKLYKNHCSSCHEEGFFSDFDYHNNGLDSVFSFSNPEDVRWGRYRISFLEEDKGAFKTASLRNIALTAPYMHDGRFETLDEVLTHYSTKVIDNDFLDSRIPATGFQFTTSQQEDIIAFLHTLTDYKFISNENYTSPF